MKSLAGKVVVITGSTRGIGLAIAEACARNGAKVVISSRNAVKVNEVVGSLQEKGYAVTGLATDVSRKDDLQQLFEHAIATWGRIDVWINNAGISSGYRPLEEIPASEIRTIVGVNLTGTLLACQLIIPYFKAQGKGILINMSGRGGNGDYAPYMVPYTATKAAVTTLTKGLAKENAAYPISIHAVVPGMVATGFYQNIKAGPEGRQQLAALPYVLKAFGVPPATVGEFFVRLAAQKPGKVTGKIYSLLSGFRLLRGIGLITWYRLTGKI
ncbi:MAG: SDR family oxidoreductase [Firmicutes bacterium]|nr:SDR family oxidoreductase [Bacillota bacterium]